jgi:medium-chain acyl-[acyl-carrier-protein] hydrolase
MNSEVTTFPRNGWVTAARPNPAAQLRLFCFTYAGGGTSYFNSWVNSLPLTVELCPIRPPGRESRLREAPYRRIVGEAGKSMVPPLAEALLPYLTKPFAFYGHSMGAIVAFETARALRQMGAGLPQALLVSGCRAPQIPDPDPPIYGLPEGEFVQAMGALNGTPTAVLENQELLALLMPVLRADFEAIETYQYSAEAPFSFPVTAVGGDNDPKAPPDHIQAWQEQTLGKFQTHTLTGDHFFIQTPQFISLLGQMVAGIR